MLTKCPECNLQISDKAVICPHCGYPLAKPDRHYTRSTKRAHRKLPNGFGSITKISGRYLRNPYLTRITVAKTETGRPILKTLGYFPSYNEAYEALVEYNRDPYSIETNLGCRELFDKWFEEYSRNVSPKSSRVMESVWKHCEAIYNIPVRNIRQRHVKACMAEGVSAMQQERIKSLWNVMLDYAVENDIVETNVARTFKVDKNIWREIRENTKGHNAFSNEDLEKLWKCEGELIADMVLVQCYTGFRPQELCSLLSKNVTDGVIVGGMKTEAGTNRMVPIHSKISCIVERYRKQGGEYLFEYDGEGLTYDQYRVRFHALMERLGISGHRPHDCRKTFVTMAKNKGVDEYAIKRIVGHSIVNDITESVYTERSPEWLKQEIDKV